MKILLINPKSSYIVKTPPLGLLSLASYVRNKMDGVEIDLVDGHAYDMDNEGIQSAFEGRRYDAIGIYSIITNADNVCDLTRRLRKNSKNIVVGGPWATACHEDVLKYSLADYVVVGEGERPFVELLGSISGIEIEGEETRYVKRGVNCRFNRNADYLLSEDIPTPAWDLIDVEYYFKGFRNSMSPVIGTRRVLPIMTSRGCPFLCIYCHNVFGKAFRPRPIDSIIDEIKFLKNKYHVDTIEVWDDVFNLDRQRVIEFCRRIESDHIDIKISFSNGVRADLLDREIIDSLYRVGMCRVNYGIESGTKRIQDVLDKRQDLEKVSENIRYASTKKLLVTGGFFILGNPTETEKEVNETIRYACDLPIDIASFFISTPNKGTRLYEMVEDSAKRKIEDTPYLQRNFNMPTISISEVPIEKMRRIVRTAYLKFYLNPKRVLRILRKLKLIDIVKNAILVTRYITLRQSSLWFE
jgi:radical SAM superfamily enzyme YgiQ (UPF0313 family)